MNYCLNCNKRTISPHCEHVDKGLEITKTSFNAKIIAAESDGWEKDWTVVLRVPAKNWDNMAYLRGIKDSGDVTVIIKTKG